MQRPFLCALALAVVAMSLPVASAYGQEDEGQSLDEPSALVKPETAEVAQEAGVDPMDLQGAVNTTRMAPRQYLYATGELQPPYVPPSPVVRGSGPFGLPPYLARVAACESMGFNPYYVYGPGRGKYGEIGLFQLLPNGLLPVFYRMGYTNPWNPWQQAEFAIYMFAHGGAHYWACAR